jgi:predicted pyridoxine 5'-phosphate oxidase superfamily flavin-nucleotide-binding protein
MSSNTLTAKPRRRRVLPVACTWCQCRFVCTSRTPDVGKLFIGQTISNIEADSAVSLAVWQGFSGYQIKAVAEHHTSGNVFAEVESDLATTMPDRTVHGVLILTPRTVFDISADSERPAPWCGLLPRVALLPVHSLLYYFTSGSRQLVHKKG